MFSIPKILVHSSTITKQNLLTLRQEYNASEKFPSICPSPISVETPRRSRELISPQKRQVTGSSPNDSPRKRIIFTNVHKNSNIEFGTVSDSVTGITPLEPFSKALKNRVGRDNQSNAILVSPKHALLYKRDGIDFLNCKLKKVTRDDSCHSLEVLKSDFDTFCGEVQTVPTRLTRLSKAKGVSHHRRRSCVCSWCGGVSTLEKTIQNHPDIPSTICQRHCGVNEDSDTNRTSTSVNSRASSWKGRISNASRISPKKSIFGSVGRASLILDGMRPSFRTTRRQSTLLLGVRKEFSSFKPQQEQKTLSKGEQPTKKRIGEDSNSQPSDCSINLEVPPVVQTLQNTDIIDRYQAQSKTISYLKFSPSTKKLDKYVKDGVFGSLKANSPQTLDISSELLDTLEEYESPLKLKNPKGNRKKKGQKKTDCITQRIKDIYSSPKTEKVLQRPQPLSIVIPPKKKACSSVSWGIDVPKSLSSPIDKSLPKLLYKKEGQTKPEKSTAPNSLVNLKPIKPIKIDTSITGSLNSARTLRTPYLSPRIMSLASPGSNTARVHKRGATLC